MKEVLQVAYLRHLQDFYPFESVKDGSITNPIQSVWNMLFRSVCPLSEEIHSKLYHLRRICLSSLSKQCYRSIIDICSCRTGHNKPSNLLQCR